MQRRETRGQKNFFLGVVSLNSVGGEDQIISPGAKEKRRRKKEHTTLEHNTKKNEKKSHLDMLSVSSNFFLL